jgi:hypothetical protein
MLINYFEINYISTGKRYDDGTLKMPRFPPELWSVYQLNEQNFARTQNKLESWHNRLNTLIGRAHVGFYTLLFVIYCYI